MKNVIICRSYGEKETLGALIVLNGKDKLFECKTIELPNLNNQNNISCVPEGNYKGSPIISPTKGKCFLIENIPNRQAIEMHIGNYATGKQVDTLGCILPGMLFADINSDGNLDVAGSTTAMTFLLGILTEEFNVRIFS